MSGALNLESFPQPPYPTPRPVLAYRPCAVNTPQQSFAPSALAASYSATVGVFPSTSE